VSKHYIPIILSALVLLIGVISVQAAVQTQAWKVAREIPIKHACSLAGFLNANQGITVGYAGEVHFTKDGGKSWPRAVNTSWCRFGLDIVNEKLAWHCGNAGHVRVSTDGGENWNAVASFGDMEPEQCRFISFVDEKTGWIAAPARFAITADGAQTWKELDSPAGNTDTAALFLRTANEGYLLDVNGVLYATQDGCKTWRSHKLPLNGKLTNFNCPTAAIQFSDADHGMVVLARKGGGIISYVTADAGKTWTNAVVSEKLYGFLYLTHDGKTLTVTNRATGLLTVLINNQ
jgi:photosystem II stability/assembly factor-like uncharacterized protein